MTPKKLPTCGECLREFRPKSNTALGKAKFCSPGCNARHRVKDPAVRARLAAIAPLGHKGWTEQGRAAYRAKMTGPLNPAWKGGVMMTSGGLYIGASYTKAPPHLHCMARRDGWIMEHRLAMALRIGRPLTRTEVVHHVNHKPRDNRIENLELWPDNSTHKRMEHGKCVDGAANLVSLPE